MGDDVSLTAYIAAAMLELDGDAEARRAFLRLRSEVPGEVGLTVLLGSRDRSRWSRGAWAV